MSLVRPHRAAAAPGAPPPVEVLLFSPIADRDPTSGDTSYTAALLAEPPSGVRYTTYDRALADGRLQLRGTRATARHHPGDLGILAGRAIELGLRRSRLTYREPTWFAELAPGAFDVVHQHLFSVRQLGRQVPVVSTGGYPLHSLYRRREGWSRPRLALADGLQLAIDVASGAHDPLLRGRRGTTMASYTERGARRLARWSPGVEVALLGTAAPDLGIPEKASDGRTIGFLAGDFTRKGGDLAVEAVTLLRRRRPDVHLLVVSGDPTARSAIGRPGVEVLGGLPREEVLRTWWPQVDVLLTPTRADCGTPYAMLEALQSSTPIVTSRSTWLDSRLRPPAVRRAPLEPAALAAELDQLLRPDELARARPAARDLWRRHLTTERLGRQLRACYLGAIERAGVPAG